MGTKIRVLRSEICESLLPRNQRYTREVDLCAQNLVKKKKRIIDMHYDKKARKYTKKNAFAETKTYIGGSDACQGDSGGPLTKYQTVKEASGKVDKRAFIIGWFLFKFVEDDFNSLSFYLRSSEQRRRMCFLQ